MISIPSLLFTVRNPCRVCSQTAGVSCVWRDAGPSSKSKVSSGITAFSVSELVGADNEGPTSPAAESSQLRVGMECAYAPSNWQESAATNANVPVENVAGAYAEGYDVQIACILADQLDRAPYFLVYAGLYTAHLISAESSVTSIRSMNCAATIFFSSKLSSEKTSLSGMAGLDFSRLRDARISSRSFSRRASAR